MAWSRLMLICPLLLLLLLKRFVTQAVSVMCIQWASDFNVAAGEMLSVAGPFIEQQMHPTVIIGAFRQALDDLLTILKDQVSIPVDITNRAEMTRIIKSCIGTKFITKWSATHMLLHICTTQIVVCVAMPFEIPWQYSSQAGYFECLVCHV